MKILLLIIFVMPLSAYARNCNLECPIRFGPSPDPSNPFYYSQQRERCMSSCEQANSQEYEQRQQADDIRYMCLGQKEEGNRLFSRDLVLSHFE